MCYGLMYVILFYFHELHKYAHSTDGETEAWSRCCMEIRECTNSLEIPNTQCLRVKALSTVQATESLRHSSSGTLKLQLQLWMPQTPSRGQPASCAARKSERVIGPRRGSRAICPRRPVYLFPVAVITHQHEPSDLPPPKPTQLQF